MRISDWSSDVCSSDLDAVLPIRRGMRNFLQGSRWQVPGTDGGDAAAHLNRASNFNHAEGIYGWPSRILTAGRTRRSPSFLRATNLPDAWRAGEIGRASCRGRGGQYVEASVVAGD